MIGRKRTLAASTIALRRADVPLRCRSQREVDHHDRVLLHDADQHDDADIAVHAELHVRDVQRQQRPERRERQPGENRDRVDEALVENLRE